MKEEEFLSLLEQSKLKSLEHLRSSNIHKMSGLEFEALVYEMMCLSAQNTPFKDEIKRTGPHGFPDIIAKKYYGVEVKLTEKDKWTSTGNSVLEGIRDKDVQSIYIVFGKFGGKLDIKYRKYQDCLVEVGVTHSPRYRIDMNLSGDNTIFHKMGIEYDSFRQLPNPIGKVKDYYKKLLKDGEELWWIDNNEEQLVNPIIRPWRTTSPDEKKIIRIEALILFPELFGKSLNKYERIAAYLIVKHNVVSPNLRDLFSAGGKQMIRINNESINVDRVYEHLYSNAEEIKLAIESMDTNELVNYWRISNEPRDNLTEWLSLIDLASGTVDKNYTASDIFKAGLYEKENK